MNSLASIFVFCVAKYLLLDDIGEGRTLSKLLFLGKMWFHRKDIEGTLHSSGHLHHIYMFKGVAWTREPGYESKSFLRFSRLGKYYLG